MIDFPEKKRYIESNVNVSNVWTCEYNNQTNCLLVYYMSGFFVQFINLFSNIYFRKIELHYRG